MNLTFQQLRDANVRRLPQFKSTSGAPAHMRPDGADWSPAQWFQALVGELGEFAEARIAFEAGAMTLDKFEKAATFELADVATYTDLLAFRSLDLVNGAEELDEAQQLMHVMAHLGAYANARKKYDRGDMKLVAMKHEKNFHLSSALVALSALMNMTIDAHKNKTIATRKNGVDLGCAVVEKFDMVSERVGSDVKLGTPGPLYAWWPDDFMAPWHELDHWVRNGRSDDAEKVEVLAWDETGSPLRWRKAQ